MLDPITDRDVEILSALETIFGKDFRDVDVYKLRATCFAITEEWCSGTAEDPMPINGLSESGQVMLMQRLLTAAIYPVS